MAFRQDIALEGTLQLNASGSHTTEWLETAGIETLRVTVRFNDYQSGSPQVILQEGISDGIEVRVQNLTVTNGRAFAELYLTGPRFRIVVNGGGTDNVVYISARSVS